MFIGKNKTNYNNSIRFNVIAPIVVLFLLVAVMLAACGNASGPGGSQTAGGGPDTQQGEQAASETVISGIVAQVNGDGSFLLAGNAESDLYIVSGKFTVTDSGGKKTDVDALRLGQRVEAVLPQDGAVMESFPAQFSPETVKIKEDGDDMIGFYMTILDEIWSDDPGLNPSNGMLFFDIGDVHNLTAGERSALIWMARSRFDAAATEAGTYDQLVDEGYIDEKLLQFKEENRLLIAIATSEEKENSFKFSASKWVSGLGADWYNDCSAEKKNGKWGYTLGGYAIS